MLSPENIRIVRPGLGLATKYYEMVLRKKVKKNSRIESKLYFSNLF